MGFIPFSFKAFCNIRLIKIWVAETELTTVFRRCAKQARTTLKKDSSKNPERLKLFYPQTDNGGIHVWRRHETASGNVKPFWLAEISHGDGCGIPNLAFRALRKVLLRLHAAPLHGNSLNWKALLQKVPMGGNNKEIAQTTTSIQNFIRRCRSTFKMSFIIFILSNSQCFF